MLVENELEIHVLSLRIVALLIEHLIANGFSMKIFKNFILNILSKLSRTRVQPYGNLIISDTDFDLRAPKMRKLIAEKIFKIKIKEKSISKLYSL